MLVIIDHYGFLLSLVWISPEHHHCVTTKSCALRPNTFHYAVAWALNGSLVVGEINASSAWRPLMLISTCPPSAQIRHGVMCSYLSVCLPPRWTLGSAQTQEMYLGWIWRENSRRVTYGFKVKGAQMTVRRASDLVQNKSYFTKPLFTGDFN